MLIHIVMLRLKSGLTPNEKESAATELMHMLQALSQSIPELLSMETGRNISTRPSAFDLVLTAMFENEAALDIYRVHPEHQKVLQRIKQLVSETAVVDYFVE